VKSINCEILYYVCISIRLFIFRGFKYPNNSKAFVTFIFKTGLYARTLEHTHTCATTYIDKLGSTIVTIFWDITPCSPLKVSRCFGETYRLHLHGRKISRVRNQRRKRWKAEVCILGLFFDPEDGGDLLLKRHLTPTRLHGAISQRIVLFRTTAVRTSNPTS
jgi:hypothetical protein